VTLARNSQLKAVERPFLVIYSPHDDVVNPRQVESTFKRLGASDKQLIPFENPGGRSNHVLAGDILSPGSTDRMAQLILTFIQARL
jgi:esterase/lipase